jgi:hypothetical protein
MAKPSKDGDRRVAKKGSESAKVLTYFEHQARLAQCYYISLSESFCCLISNSRYYVLRSQIDSKWSSALNRPKFANHFD